MNTQLTTTDYTNIANGIYSNRPEENKIFEMEYEAKGCTLFIEVKYNVEYRDVIGGSYEGYDFERLTEVYNETFEVVSYDVYNADGDPIETNFSEGILLNLLNN